MSVRKALVGSLALVLLWAIVTASLAAYLADVAPKAALYFDPNEPEGLLNRAGQLVNVNENIKVAEPIVKAAAETKDSAEAATKRDVPDREGAQASDEHDSTEAASIGGNAADPDAPAKIELWAAQALAHDPLNARALRMLGQVAYAAGNDKRGDAMMEAAAERSLHESLALYSTVRKNYREGHYPTALGYADALLRTRGGVLPHLMPMFGRMAENPKASASLKHLLTKAPPWRSQFFAALPQSVTDARTPLGIFLALKESSAPPSQADFVSYLNLLVQKDFHELAYYTWLQFLPPEQLATSGHVFNGNFELEPSGAPFDWNFRNGSGVSVQRAPRPDIPSESALLVEFGPGRAQFDGVSQTILLPPGDYRLRAEYKSDLASERGLKWSVTCDGAPKPLGESISVSGVDASWKDLDFAFRVPDTGCDAQTLKLALDARSASEKFLYGSIWYDSLRIARDDDLAEDRP